MGVIRDIINNVDNSKEVAADIRENLHILMSLADSKVKQFSDEIIIDLKTGKTTDDLTVSITKTLRSYTEARAITQDTTTDVLSEVKNVINDVISDHSAQGIVSGIAGIAHQALNTVIGTGEGTEQETRLYMVTADYPAIVRFDFAFWARKIKAESIKKHCETALACVMYKSAVDISKLAYNDFLALYGPILNAGFGSNPAEMEQMIEKSQEIYDRFLRASQPNTRQRSAMPMVDTDFSQAMRIVTAHKEPQGIVLSASRKPAVGAF